ncbi:MAG: CDP-diacylglycerol--glycerol-3-phosphate 3-phosphatidyltransferase [Ignavibacteria bacterium]|nr:CDP-diacylglycerol--glycerol-3-phosphate 3-phosphatidyltransferase [Ignavibacteria bacterium]
MVLPNQLTVLRIILTPVFLFFFLSEDITFKQISIVIFIIAAITDWYDGWLARKFNYITTWGKFMDPLADKILTSAAFFGFVFIDVLQLWMVIAIVIRDFLITILRLIAEHQNKSFYTSKAAKWKTFIQMAFIYYLLTVYTLKTFDFIYVGNENIFSLLLDENIVNYSMFAVTVFTLYTGFTYLFKNKLMIKRLIINED